MAKKKQKYYVVWKGKKPGVFSTWKACQQSVQGFKGAKYKSFFNKAQAEQAFKKGPGPYWGKKKKQGSKLSPSQLAKITAIDFDSIAVDAACAGNPGKMEYRGVSMRTHCEIFRKGPFQKGTNNIGEFLALVHALALLQQKGLQKSIYTDSITAMSWVRKKKCRTKLTRNSKNEKLFRLVERAENWLKINPSSNQILKWDTKKWGEIPADFGRK